MIATNPWQNATMLELGGTIPKHGGAIPWIIGTKLGLFSIKPGFGGTIPRAKSVQPAENEGFGLKHPTLPADGRKLCRAARLGLVLAWVDLKSAVFRDGRARLTLVMTQNTVA